MTLMKLFVPLNKVDVEQRRVWGRATQEIKDKSGEVFDYETSKPNFEKWSSEIAKATEHLGEDGQSLGNVRAMHGKVAAGKLINIDFQDAEKAIDVCAEIVDDTEWQKCLKGVYTGFSIGGSYEKKWTDADGNKRYTADPSEISIVDNPCVGTAHFSMVKADGVTEDAPFATASVGTLRKGLYAVSRLADLLQSLVWLACDADCEAEFEGDASPIPARLAAWVGEGGAILQDMTAEEVAELLASLPNHPLTDGGLEMAAKAWDAVGLTKAGAKYSKATKDALSAAHKLIKDADAHMAGMGYEKEDDGEAEKAATNDLAKLATEKDEALAKATNDLAKMALEKEALAKEVARLGALPQPTKGVANAFAKVDDTETTTASAEDAEKLKKDAEAMPDGIEKVKALVKLAFQKPM